MKRLMNWLSPLVLLAATCIPVASASALGSNLVANPGFETANGNNPASWTGSSWGTNTAKFTYDTTGHSGRSGSIVVSGYKSGDAKWGFAPVNVTANTSYTFSNWYKSTAISGIDVEIITTSGATSYIWLANPAVSASWKQQSFAFTTPANAKTVTVFQYLDRNGTLSVDDVSLATASGTPTPTPTPTPPTPTPPTPTPPAATANLIANPSVETATGTTPANWTSGGWGTNTKSMTYETTGQDGSRSLKATISKYTNGDVKWMFTPVAVTAGQTYAYSDYYKSNVDTEVDAEVTMSDGSVQYAYLGTTPANTSTWAKASYQFTAPAGAVKVSIFHVLAKVGYLQTDNFSFASYQPTQFNRAIVSLTFDDGWRSIYTNGLPALSKYGLASTQYLNSQPITDGYADYMTYAQVKDWYAKGHELAWHTRTHADITTLSAANLTTELTIPSNFLTGIGQNKSVFKNFASPYGAYNANSVAQVRKTYASHRSTDVGYNSKDSLDLNNIKVQNITNTTTPADVKAWVDQAVANKTWLVIVYHEVDAAAEDPTYAVTPSNLDAELNIVKQSGVTVKTVDAALAELQTQL